MTNRQYLESLRDEDFVYVINQIKFNEPMSRTNLLLDWLKEEFKPNPDFVVRYKPGYFTPEPKKNLSFSLNEKGVKS